MFAWALPTRWLGAAVWRRSRPLPILRPCSGGPKRRPCRRFGSSLARASAVVSSRSRGWRREWAHSPLRQRSVLVAVRRREQERYAALVRNGLLRQPRQGAPALPEDDAITPSSGGLT